MRFPGQLRQERVVWSTRFRTEGFIKNLPPVFRVQRVTQRAIHGNGQFGVLVCLYHATAEIKVHARYQQFDTQLKPGCLVKIRWAKKHVTVNGSISIDRLIVLQEPESSYALFDTIPECYAGSNELMSRARALEKRMNETHRLLLNHVFWQHERLDRFLKGPSSLSGHHNDCHGNFRHTVEVAELALGLQEVIPVAAPSLLITACLLHDAGKADEYTFPRGSKYGRLSERGILMGHRTTVLEWVAVAHDRMNQKLPKTHYEALIHALAAVSSAPEWTGCRAPTSREAFLVNAADRASSQADLFMRNAPAEEGFGTYHKHLGRQPFLIKEAVR